MAIQERIMGDNEAAMTAIQQPDYSPEEHSTENDDTPFHQHYQPSVHQDGGVGGSQSGDSSAMNALAAAAEARQSSSPPSSSSSTKGTALNHLTEHIIPASTTTAVAATSSLSTSTTQSQHQITTPSPPLSATNQYIPPGGRVVESGQEQTGRWTREEHEAFLKGLQLYGKEWKKVAAGVKTRTVVQTRTHAQKYFQKMTKGLEVRYSCGCHFFLCE
jgi:SHAQKYF class myb-like DNA-binding protein